MMYVQENEVYSKLKIVTILKDNQTISEAFLKDLDVLDRAYPEINIEFVQIQGVFNPEMVSRLSAEWKIPINFMFIASLEINFPLRFRN